LPAPVAPVETLGAGRSPATTPTPATSIYFANRGTRTANVPLVPGIPLPHQLEHLKKPLVVSPGAGDLPCGEVTRLTAPGLSSQGWRANRQSNGKPA
jgi:hypothetical protein